MRLRTFSLGRLLDGGPFRNEKFAETVSVDVHRLEVLKQLLAVSRHVVLTCTRDRYDRLGREHHKPKGPCSLNLRKERLSEQGHVVVKFGSVFKCQRCFSRFHAVKGRMSNSWPSRCAGALALGPRSSGSGPSASGPSVRSAIGHPAAERSHPSHVLAELKGILYCRVCGSFAVQNAVNLAVPCPPVVTATGRRNLDRLSKGQPPKYGMTFPAP